MQQKQWKVLTQNDTTERDESCIACVIQEKAYSKAEHRDSKPT
jgi:hypothetical protein